MAIFPLMAVLAFQPSCKPAEEGPQGRKIEKSSEMNPSALPASKATLVLKDSKIPVNLTRKVKGDTIEISLGMGPDIFEVEIYRSTSSAFDFVGLKFGGTDAGDVYDPPIPLLKFPMTVGDSWKWKGKNIFGSGGHTAEAVVTTSQQSNSMAVTVEVALEIESGGPMPAKRKLVFVFEPDKGVVRRTFGESSERQP